VNLVGSLVTVRLNEGDAPLSGAIQQISSDLCRALIRFNTPMKIADHVYELAVAATRHEGVSFADLTTGCRLACALTFIPSDRFNARDPFNLSWWRGGGASISEIALRKS